MTKQKYTEEPIAIVGSACRFPGGASSPSKLWDLLRDPRDVQRDFEPERLNLARFYHEDGEHHGSTNVISKSYLLEQDSRLFDAPFFGITPMEAAGMDPQQRQLLETVYEAFEAAGLTLEALRASLTSVYIGCMTNDWANIQLRDPETLPQYTATGTANSILSNRISYVFDLKGPSETIDTACSSSLVALHHAARGLIDGDSECAVVAGVNIILDPTLYITESKLHMLSPEARSRMWDASANGYARGEGTGALVLKTLSRALADGDDIEAIIRSSGVNSDGQSPGITMPFAPTQAALIRHTYKRAGLDPIKDRPQYFECHGTGTPAGDPVEARAVSEALVGAAHCGVTTSENPIYVGSIKTVIGHLEGAAGLAGVMKVILALKHRVIPPNLLFEKLNPAIQPYYGPLRIATKAVPWPKLAPGVPARASVNSFGFGGTNAHAIIESYEPTDSQNNDLSEAAPGPFVFSAASGPSLLRTVQEHLFYLKGHPEVDLDRLSSILQTRRTTHRVRAHFTGSNVDSLIANMETWANSHASLPRGSKIGHQPSLVNPTEAPGILGVFTGQGAQWPSMGRELLKRSPIFRESLEACEAILRNLPRGDAPSWSLVEMLTADKATSRLGEAELSQPLCTAVQLGLVDLLNCSGVRFDAVVGHSSGEIGAVYACGIIDRTAAMQIAYYRGLHAKLANAAGRSGGMLAAGLSLSEGMLFCDRPQFKGRLAVAASNAPQSVTLSGDLDAVLEAKAKLDADGTFARQLQVDTAYHSHHMQACADAYLESLVACNIKPCKPAHVSDGSGRRGPIWNSSVRGDTELLDTDLEDLAGPYWVANMVRPVLFAQAVESSVWHGGPFDVAIEVGPHPALKGPVEQVLKASYGAAPLYTGSLKRGGDDAEAYTTALGVVWAQLGPGAVDFAGLRSVFRGPQSPPAPPRVLKGLPAYAWDHDRVHWRESAMSRRYRTGTGSPHELLGRRAPDDNDHELRWRNVLRVSEVPWLRGHTVLGEVLLPGAAYISLAAEAARQIGASFTGKRQVQLLDVTDVDILRPVVVPDNKDGVETLFTARMADKNGTGAGSRDEFKADFCYYVVSDPNTGAMMLTCRGTMTVWLEPSDLAIAEASDVEASPTLPQRLPTSRQDLVDVDCKQVYALFDDLGLAYTGPFHALTTSRRCLGYSAATGTWNEGSINSVAGGVGSTYAVHPAILDVAFQALLVARAHPASRELTTAILPSHIDRVRVTPSMARQVRSKGATSVDFESWAVSQSARKMVGDISIYEGDETLLQIEGLTLSMVGEPDASKDRPIFAKTIWAPDVSLGLPDIVRNDAHDVELLDLTEACERVAMYYARRLAEALANEDPSTFSWFHQRHLEANNEHIQLAAAGKHPVLRREWFNDGPAVLKAIDEKYPESVQLTMLHAVGRQFPAIVRGEVPQLEIMTKDDLLNRFFMEDVGCLRVNDFLATTLHHITVKYPRCKILEIGAGTGGTTWAVLNKIGDAYSSYTFTDVSAGFLPAAADKFAAFSQKMEFKTLDIADTPETQGYEPHSYDIVIAANVLHATKNLETTMRNARSMLRPGGYLLLFETTGTQNMSIPFIFGGLKSWWYGEEADRRLRPIVSTRRWDEILKATGYSGVDMIARDLPDENKHTTALLVTQAVNDAVASLRAPLAHVATAPIPVEGLVLVGGRTARTVDLLARMHKLLPRSWRSRLKSVEAISEDDEESLELAIQPGTDVICLQDLDEPLFTSHMTAGSLSALQQVLLRARNLLWVTTSSNNSAGHSPRAIMFQGIARVAHVEMPHLQVQLLGLDDGLAAPAAARRCVEAFLRLRQMGSFAASDGGTGVLKVGEGSGDEADGVVAAPLPLWAREPESEVLANNQVIIPRVVPDRVLNETYIASQRTVAKQVRCGTDAVVEAVRGPSGRMTLVEAKGETAGTAASPDTSRVTVAYSLHLPASSSMSQDGKSIFLVCGRDEQDRTVVAVAATNASTVTVERQKLVAIDSQHCTAASLADLAENLLIRTLRILTRTDSAGSVMLCDPSPSLVTSLLGASPKPLFATSSDSDDVPSSWTRLHRHASRRAIQQVIPASVTTFIDCSVTAGSAPVAHDFKRLDDLRVALEPRQCRVSRLDGTIVHEVLETGVSLLLLLRASYADTVCHVGAHEPRADSIPATKLAGMDPKDLENRVYVSEWKHGAELTITVPPLQTESLFRPDRTYLMVGAAGGLGLSICRWMLSQGAKSMVITSRNPRIDDAFFREAEQHGASVHVRAMDVADKESVTSVVAGIRNTLPPIGGVCNAAMVLSDRMFLDMSITDLNDTLKPKVDGSEHLDTLFSSPPTTAATADSNNGTTYPPLDFFVMLSSSATVLGNIGQANYHIANLFMASMAASRRARGLAGSVIHVGHVSDVGYVVNAKGRTAALEKHFREIRLTPLSETDVHHAFAQAIRGGHPAGSSHDIIMGVKPAEAETDSGPDGTATESKIPWLANPRLGHLVPIHGNSLQQQQQQQGANGGQGGSGSLQQRVAEAGDISEEAAAAVVLEAICAKLEATLQLPAGQAAENAERPIIDLGIDSLVAVEIRTWFLKELGAEVPVVKILGGDTLVKTCTNAAKTVLARRPRNKQPTTALAESSSAPKKPQADVPAAIEPTARPRPAGELVIPPQATEYDFSQGPLDTSATEISVDPTSVFLSEDDNESSTGASQITELSDPRVDSSKHDAAQVVSQQQQQNPITTKAIDAKKVSAPEDVRVTEMSRSQARFWFLSNNSDDPAAFNMVFKYRVRGPLNIKRLRQALSMTTRHHECLRMRFFQRVGDGRPMQGLLSSSRFELRAVEDATDEDLASAIEALKTRRWNIEVGETLGVTVLSRPDDVSHDLIFGYHHIISDVVGFAVFLQDLGRAYSLQPLDRASSGSHMSYTERSWQREQINGYGEALTFWKDEFKVLPEPLPLLASAKVRVRPEGTSTSGINSEYCTLSAAQTAAVRSVCRRLGISAFHFHLAALQVLLAREADTDDVCIGIVDANRGDGGDDQVSRMVGCFVNVLPVRVAGLEPARSFSEVARAASRKALAAFAHAGVPLEVMLDAIGVPRWADGSTSPLFQAAINYRAAGWGELPLGPDCTMSLCLDDGKDVQPPYDISLGVIDMGETCTVDLHCLDTLYSPDAVHKLAQSYIRLIDAFALEPEDSIGKCALYAPTDIEHALELGTGTKMEFGWPATLPGRVRDMQKLAPDAPAVTDAEGTTHAYTQLLLMVDQVSAALTHAGCGTAKVVGVLCEPGSIYAVAAMLALLEAGCIYMPLDTSLPASRHAAMAKSAEPYLVVYQRATDHYLHALRDETSLIFQELCVDDQFPASRPVDTSPPVPAKASVDHNKANTPAALLFTSGSTGTPKGIMLTEGNIINHVALKAHELSLDRNVVVLQQSSLGFDMSLIQIFTALANGGHLVLLHSDQRQDPLAVTDLMRKHAVSLTIATPSEYLAWMRFGDSHLRACTDSWRHACMGGELVSAQLKRDFSRLGASNLRMTNCYGPTEITAAATFHNITLRYHEAQPTNAHDDEHDDVLYAVGKALPNYSIRILDSEGNPRPVGYTGEICIGGKGVALGYLSRESPHGLAAGTNAFFIEERDGVIDKKQDHSRLYRTGDQGRLLENGTLLCYGRIAGDAQVKLRGLRVELPEVESAVLRASAGLFRRVAVLKRGDVLVAYAELADGKSMVPAEDILARVRLPQYFIPAAIVVVPSLPTTANGKLDHRALAALPLPSASSAQQQSLAGLTASAPMTVAQGELRLLWERVLPVTGAAPIAPTSDFFLRGGNSMLLMRLRAAIRESMGIDVPTRKLYRASTLAQMAQAVAESREAAASAAGEPEDINWAAETAVPAWLEERITETTSGYEDDDEEDCHGEPPAAGAKGLNIVLTGATGFLGSHILRELIQAASVQTVHCIAVDVDNVTALSSTTTGTTTGSNKVKVYTGSLADARNLGLTADEWATLEERADVIIHAGASGHCLNSYATLRAPNVASTHQLAALALARRVPLLYVSSNRVALLGGQTVQPAVSLAGAAEPPLDGSEGFTSSKWASEVFLENLMRKHHHQAAAPRETWRAAVHRPCVLVGEQAPNSDSMNAILRFSLLMRTVPKLRRGRGYIDFTPIEGVATKIAQAALQMATAAAAAVASSEDNKEHQCDGDSRCAVDFVHHSSGDMVPVDEFGAALARRYGGEFKTVDMREWIALALQRGIDPLITAYLDGVIDTDEEMVFPFLGTA
ncbi:hybrid polyketide synthase [Microdochium nivale]|nr:hybrid polyketide synthase [Microdochium nivale]